MGGAKGDTTQTVVVGVTNVQGAAMLGPHKAVWGVKGHQAGEGEHLSAVHFHHPNAVIQVRDKYHPIDGVRVQLQGTWRGLPSASKTTEARSPLHPWPLGKKIAEAISVPGREEDRQTFWGYRNWHDKESPSLKPSTPLPTKVSTISEWKSIFRKQWFMVSAYHVHSHTTSNQLPRELDEECLPSDEEEGREKRERETPHSWERRRSHTTSITWGAIQHMPCGFRNAALRSDPVRPGLQPNGLHTEGIRLNRGTHA